MDMIYVIKLIQRFVNIIWSIIFTSWWFVNQIYDERSYYDWVDGNSIILDNEINADSPLYKPNERDITLKPLIMV